MWIISSRSRVLLMLNDEIVAPRQGIDYSTMYHLVNVQDPQPELLCMLQRDSGNICVGGLALEGGRKYSFLTNTLQYRKCSRVRSRTFKVQKKEDLGKGQNRSSITLCKPSLKRAKQEEQEEKEWIGFV